MKKQIQNVKIIGQDHKGRGIVRLEDKVIFVYKALPEEICDIEIIKENRKYKEATVIRKICDRSVVSPCPYYEQCGGCDLLHQTYEDQLSFKERKVKEVLSKFAKMDVPIRPIVFDQPFFYRNKIILHNLGLYQKGTNDVVFIERCMLVDEKINQIIKRLQAYSKNTNDIVEQAMIRLSNKGEILLSIAGKIQKKRFQKQFQDVDVIFVNHVLLTTKDRIVDKIHEVQFEISNHSFYQVNQFVTSKLYKLVIDVYKNYHMKTVLDLYCGTGTISLLVAPYVENVIGVEIVQEAVENANHNKELNCIKNVEFICGKVEDFINTFKNIDGIIVDPPRSGLDAKTLHTIAEIKPQIITYVSCDVVTLARDLNFLKNQYEVQEVTPVDMFPNTYHVECVCVLKTR